MKISELSGHCPFKIHFMFAGTVLREKEKQLENFIQQAEIYMRWSLRENTIVSAGYTTACCQIFLVKGQGNEIIFLSL